MILSMADDVSVGFDLQQGATVTNARGVERILPLEGYNSPSNPQQGIINPRGSIEL